MTQMNMTQEEFEAVVQKYREWKKITDDAQAELDILTDQLKLEMTHRGVEKAQAGLFEVRYQTSKSTRLDSKALKAELPDVYDKYSVTSETKRFTVV